MVIPTYKVEGIHYDNATQAVIVAERIWGRYDRSRDIIIYEIDHHGDETIFQTLHASRDCEGRDPDTIDMFED